MSGFLPVSVLMSLYHAECPLNLDKSMSSLYTQTQLPHEVLLVIDGPIGDKLELIVTKWKAFLPIKCLYLPENVGLSSALNIGLNECENELIARFDTDDVCFPERFHTQSLFMTNNPTIDICGGFAKFIDSNGSEYSQRTLPTEHEKIKKLIWACPMIHPSVMFRKSSILGIGSYSLSAPYRQDDYELWIRAIDSGLIFHNLPEYLIQYRYNIDDFKKNTFSVGWNRFKIGLKPWFRYDRGGIAFLGLLYPLIRASLPNIIAVKLSTLVRNYDPRVKG
ncbi:glycosyltransferase [Pseudoalteromonas sp. Z1A8]|uniref:glycosyltransferase n=1 Tax=Pseudoalteromonas sp. Z1A8 TaxID=2686354 RepID=UPI00140A93DB|nr:glycosyltransferase [Pseudoalteromonas sp. Z1A8]